MFFSKQSSMFYRQLSTMLSSGMPIAAALDEMLKHIPASSFRPVVEYLRQAVEGGGTLADACAGFPAYFPEWQTGVIRAGEKSGKLADTLAMIAGQLEKNYGDRLKLLVGLSYPGFLLLVALALAPLMNIGSCGLGGCIGALAGKAVFLALAVAAGFFLWRLSGDRVKSFGREILPALPIVGRLVRQFAITRFIRALQSLTASGVPIMTAWKLAAGASGNRRLEQRLLACLTAIENGGTLADALAKSSILPPYMTGMIASGEKSGSIVKMLDSVAQYCEKENEAAIGVLVKTVPIVAYVLAAMFIGAMVISSYSRIFSAMSSF